MLKFILFWRKQPLSLLVDEDKQAIDRLNFYVDVVMENKQQKQLYNDMFE